MLYREYWGDYVKYFTDDVLTFDPFASDEEQVQHDNKWEQALNAYRQRFQTLESRLLKGVFSHYLKSNFHDYDLINIRTEETKGKSLPLRLEITVTNGNSTFLISYSSVKEIQMKLNSSNPYRGLGSFVYEEILDIDDELLSHEISLSSQSHIIVIFKNKKMKITKLSDSQKSVT